MAYSRPQRQRWKKSYPFTQTASLIVSAKIQVIRRWFYLNENYQHGYKSYSFGSDRPPFLPAERQLTLYTPEPLRKHHAIKTRGKSGGKAPHVLDLAPAKFRCLSASSSWYVLDGRLRRPRRKYGRDGKE